MGVLVSSSFVPRPHSWLWERPFPSLLPKTSFGPILSPRGHHSPHLAPSQFSFPKATPHPQGLASPSEGPCVWRLPNPRARSRPGTALLV